MFISSNPTDPIIVQFPKGTRVGLVCLVRTCPVLWLLIHSYKVTFEWECLTLYGLKSTKQNQNRFGKDWKYSCLYCSLFNFLLHLFTMMTVKRLFLWSRLWTLNKIGILIFFLIQPWRWSHLDDSLKMICPSDI